MKTTCGNVKHRINSICFNNRGLFFGCEDDVWSSVAYQSTLIQKIDIATLWQVVELSIEYIWEDDGGEETS